MLLRLGVALSLMWWSLLAVDLLEMVWLTVLSCFLLWIRGAKVILLIRSLRLLLWLFVPIILFQGLFTPGMYVQYPFALPITVEGLQRALFLCSHLLLMFVAALSCFRLLKNDEWCFLLLRLPYLGQHCAAYILLLPTLRRLTTDVLQQQRAVWLANHHPFYRKWQSLPPLLLESLTTMFNTSKDQALMLWENWSTREKVLHPSVVWWGGFRGDMFYASLCVLGWYL